MKFSIIRQFSDWLIYVCVSIVIDPVVHYSFAKLVLDRGSQKRRASDSEARNAMVAVEDQAFGSACCVTERARTATRRTELACRG